MRFSYFFSRVTLMSFTAPVVDHVAMPKGLDGSTSERMESVRSVVTMFTTFSSSIHHSMEDWVTRSRM